MYRPRDWSSFVDTGSSLREPGVDENNYNTLGGDLPQAGSERTLRRPRRDHQSAERVARLAPIRRKSTRLTGSFAPPVDEMKVIAVILDACPSSERDHFPVVGQSSRLARVERAPPGFRSSANDMATELNSILSPVPLPADEVREDLIRLLLTSLTPVDLLALQRSPIAKDDTPKN